MDTQAKLNVTGSEGVVSMIRSLMEVTFHPLIAVSQAGKIVDLNESAVALCGKSRRQLIGSDICLYFEETELSGQVFRQALTDGFVWNSPLTVRHVSGKTAGVFCNARVYQNDRGAPQGVLLAIRQTGDLERVNQELLESRRRWETAERVAGVGFLDCDLKTDVIRLSNEACRIYGFEPTASMTLADLVERVILPGEKDFISKSLQAAKDGERIYDVDHPVVRSDGKPAWVHARAEVSYDENGKPVTLLGTILDITQRKLAEEHIRHINSVLRAIRNVNQWIVRVKDRRQLLQGICDNLIETRGYYHAWIALLNETGALALAASAGMEEEASVLDGYLKHGSLTCCMLKALAQADVMVVTDPPSACADCPIAKKYTNRGAMAVRIEHAGEIFGLLVVSTFPEIAIDVEEHGLFEEVSRDIAIALHDLAADEKRIKAEEALKNENERFQTFIQSNIVGIVIANAEGKVIAANDYYLNLLGVSRQDFMDGKVDWRKFTPQEWLPGDEKAIQELRQHGICQPYEKEYIRADGSRVPILLADALIPGPDEEIAAFVLDISERKQAEEKLRYSEELLRDTGKIAHIGGWEFDPITGKGTWTDEVARIHDLEPGNETNMQIGLSYYHGESRAKIEGAIQHLIAYGIPYDLELELTTAKGSHKWVRTIGRPVIVDGKVINVRGSFQDITSRKLAEEEVLKLNTELELRVEERTSRLSEVNAELEAFTYSVSHDLRAPLLALEGFSQALKEDYGDRLDETGKDYISRLHRAAERMDHIIQDLLAYSRLSRTEIRLESLSPEKAVDDALYQLDAEIQLREAQVTVDRPMPLVVGTRATLAQVLVNLLNNAIKFVAPGVQPQVHVWAERRSGCVRLWVQDNGIGIAPEYQERIFRAFERLHSIEAYPGTGIGLAIVRKGIERMCGRVGVESAEGKGSRFWIELSEAV